jgi:hypothetical protein
MLNTRCATTASGAPLKQKTISLMPHQSMLINASSMPHQSMPHQSIIKEQHIFSEEVHL